MPRAIPKATEEAVATAIREGRPYRDIVQQHGVSLATVNRVAGHHGLSRRQLARPMKPYRRPWPAWPNWQNEVVDKLPLTLAATWTSLRSVKSTIERLAATDYREMVWAEGDRHRRIIANHERLVTVWTADVQGMIEALRRAGMTDDQIERHMPDTMEDYMTVIAEDFGVQPRAVS
jgi:hypothetical protein